MTTAMGFFQRRHWRVWAVLAALGCVALLASTGCSSGAVQAAPVSFSTPYQAVVLINNSVYYGKLSGWGTQDPVLTDVFYIVSKQDPTGPGAQLQKWAEATTRDGPAGVLKRQKVKEPSWVIEGDRSIRGRETWDRCQPASSGASSAPITFC